jgi:hypothetical protein
MVSLKATTDFAVKFDLSNINCSDAADQFTYERYLRKLLEFVMDNDADIRILAI